MRLVAFILSVLLAVSATASPTANQLVVRPRMRGRRYCDILVVHGRPGHFTATVYDTLGLGDCPSKQWATINPQEIKRETGAKAVVLDGPRYFVMDSDGLVAPGPVTNLGGLEVRELETAELHTLSNLRPYSEYVSDRQSRYEYDAGKYVYELLGPGGKDYVMQSYSLQVDPGLDELDLRHLGSRLKLPKGWEYRARKLREPMIVANAGSKAYVIQDDLKDTYQRLQ